MIITIILLGLFFMALPVVLFVVCNVLAVGVVLLRAPLALGSWLRFLKHDESVTHYRTPTGQALCSSKPIAVGVTYVKLVQCSRCLQKLQK